MHLGICYLPMELLVFVWSRGANQFDQPFNLTLSVAVCASGSQNIKTMSFHKRKWKLLKTVSTFSNRSSQSPFWDELLNKSVSSVAPLIKMKLKSFLSIWEQRQYENVNNWYANVTCKQISYN